jgi:Glu-tRNA(Gln) amidotransferase subunit E-like FAD-binding protein
MNLKVKKESVDKLFEYYTEYRNSSSDYSDKFKFLDKSYKIANSLGKQVNNEYDFSTFVQLTWLTVKAGKPVSVLYQMLKLIDIDVV